MSVSAMPASPSALPAADAQVATGGRVRDPRIDATKAIAILLVVFCHAKGVPHGMTLFAYSFHVPLFSWYQAGWQRVMRRPRLGWTGAQSAGMYAACCCRTSPSICLAMPIGY